jgi:hypothetical protein
MEVLDLGELLILLVVAIVLLGSPIRDIPIWRNELYDLMLMSCRICR